LSALVDIDTYMDVDVDMVVVVVVDTVVDVDTEGDAFNQLNLGYKISLKSLFQHLTYGLTLVSSISKLPIQALSASLMTVI
jgi:hypothetical protein